MQNSAKRYDLKKMKINRNSNKCDVTLYFYFQVFLKFFSTLNLFKR